MWSGTVDALVGWCFCLLGLALWRRSRPWPSVLMLATGVLWLLGGGVAPAVFAHRGPLIHLLVGYPRGRSRDVVERTVVVAGYLVALVLPIGRSNVVTVGMAVLVCTVGLRGYRRAHGSERPARLTSLLASTAVFGVLGFGAVARLSGHHVDTEVLLWYQLTLVAVAVALFVALRWGRWDRTAIATLAVDLGDDGSGGSLRDRLAAALGDPSLVVGYVMEDSDLLVDEAGTPVDVEPPRAGRAVTPILDAGRPIAVLMHDAEVLADPVLLASVTALSTIALANVRLHAEVQDRLAEVQASRRRLLTVGDVERARLEADLRSGPQRRLQRVAALLAGLPGDQDDLPEQVAASRDAIRDFARGVHPHTLTEAGLGPALRELAAPTPFPIDIQVPCRRFADRVEAAAYFLCAEALTNTVKYAHATKVAIRCAVQGDELVVTVGDDGVGGADASNGSGLTGLADRLDVLGGTLTVDSRSGAGTTVTGRIPLARRSGG